MLTQEELEAMLMLDEEIKDALASKKGYENIRQTLKDEEMVKAQAMIFEEDHNG
jgi:hypothetical protein